jgi:hypothetical protein
MKKRQRLISETQIAGPRQGPLFVYLVKGHNLADSNSLNSR